MNIAMIYLCAVLLAFLAAPVALLAPIFLAVSLPLVDAVEPQAPVAVVSTVRETASVAAPFVAVYAARGPVARRPMVHPWSVSPVTPTPYLTGKDGYGLKGAAKRTAIAKAGRKACVATLCPTVRK